MKTTRGYMFATLLLVALMLFPGCESGENPTAINDVSTIETNAKPIDVPWVAAGPGTIEASDLSMVYSTNTNGIWTFSSSHPTSSRTVPLHWEYQGYHAWYQVRVFVEAFIGDQVFPILNLGPVNCCSAPSGGFNESGSFKFLNVPPNTKYGFRFGGSNWDSDARLIGTFTVGQGMKEEFD
jgi:hypothetical protein